ncbi:hypothetical protein M0813_17857 [Anaeramoeba flamelloides]|uniref:BLOC-1-related complex subunit 6 C-terminal helix domain-containing protein n=1 Tax=Anaeramoeba flamelloides TaxID=1746091 RepID=A0AAV7YAU8_9EUKA|nr:hypothetical protein M0812_26536 [Anaeramoeba flamelloides]KAJ6248194.1 hypothetical protein M0813_17857 [Anaeramoeba flamelloides]
MSEQNNQQEKNTQTKQQEKSVDEIQIKSMVVPSPLHELKIDNELTNIKETIKNLEEQSKIANENLNHFFGILKNALSAMSTISQDSMQLFDESSSKMNQSVVDSIEGLYELITKTKQLDTDLKFVVKLAHDIKQIRLKVDTVDSVIKKMIL